MKKFLSFLLLTFGFSTTVQSQNIYSIIKENSETPQGQDKKREESIEEIMRKYNMSNEHERKEMFKEILSGSMHYLEKGVGQPCATC